MFVKYVGGVGLWLLSGGEHSLLWRYNKLRQIDYYASFKYPKTARMNADTEEKNVGCDLVK